MRPLTALAAVRDYLSELAPTVDPVTRSQCFAAVSILRHVGLQVAEDDSFAEATVADFDNLVSSWTADAAALWHTVEAEVQVDAADKPARDRRRSQLAAASRLIDLLWAPERELLRASMLPQLRQWLSDDMERELARSVDVLGRTR